MHFAKKQVFYRGLIMKKIFSVILSVCILIGIMVPAFATGKATKLRFDENGEFKILHLSDCQDGYPAKEKMINYIDYMLKTYQPDLVVLGGDNTVSTQETKEAAIEELTSLFVENETYFTLVFGNHDHEQGVDNETNLKYYQKYGGEYCLAYDVDPEMSGTANHNLPIYASQGDTVKFNLWMLDTGAYVYDEDGNRLGYDSVRPDQIEWYKETSEALEAQGGKKVPSMVFQHMIVQEIWDEMFFKVPFYVDTLTEKYGDTIYFFGPDTSVLNGFLFEPPSPGYYNHGEFDAMVERGDVLAILVGHDHYNTYDVEREGIRLINTPGASFNAYGTEFTRGSRLITLHEDDSENFDTEVITVNDAAIQDKAFAESVGTTPFEAALWKGLGYILLALSEFSGIFASLVFWD